MTNNITSSCFKTSSGLAMANSRRGDEYYRSLYAKEPDFHQLALQDADFKAMWDHRRRTRVATIDADSRAVSAQATSWTSPTRLLSNSLPRPF